MRDLDDIEQRALAFIDERELVRDLVEMVRVPSVSGHLPRASSFSCWPSSSARSTWTSTCGRWTFPR